MYSYSEPYAELAEESYRDEYMGVLEVYCDGDTEYNISTETLSASVANADGVGSAHHRDNIQIDPIAARNINIEMMNNASFDIDKYTSIYSSGLNTRGADQSHSIYFLAIYRQIKLLNFHK